MKQLSDKEAKKYGIHTVHHEMDNGELRFRLVSDHGSSYIMTKSTEHNGWQKSHVHYQKQEFYLVEKGVVFIALLIDYEVQIKKLCENDSMLIPLGVPHNVRMSDNALLHTIKCGTTDEDWNGCEELDRLLSDIKSEFITGNEGGCL